MACSGGGDCSGSKQSSVINNVQPSFIKNPPMRQSSMLNRPQMPDMSKAARKGKSITIKK